MMKKGIVTASLLILSFSMAAFSCTSSKNEESKIDTPAVQPDKTESKAGPAPVELDIDKVPEIVATVNGIEIDKKAYWRVVKNIKKQMAFGGDTLTQERFDTINKNVLDGLLNTELLYLESKANDVALEEKEIKSQLALLKSQFGSDEEFKKYLSSEEITLEELNTEIRKGLSIRKLIQDKVISKVKINDQQVLEYFNANKEQFQTPKMVRASHILLRLEEDEDEKKVVETQKRMDEIMVKFKSGEDFAELAKKYSEGPTAEKGGDLGSFPQGVMVKEFDDAVFSMKEGDVSKVVRTQFGLHVIKVFEVREERPPTMEEAKGDVERILEQKARNEAIERFIVGLREKADIKTYL